MKLFRMTFSSVTVTKNFMLRSIRKVCRTWVVVMQAVRGIYERLAGLVISAAAEFPIVGQCCVTPTTHAIVTKTHPRTRMGSGLVICT